MGMQTGGIDIDINTAVTVTRVAAVTLAGVGLLFWARVGSAWLGAGLLAVLAGFAAKLDGGTLTRLDAHTDHWLAAHRTVEWQRETVVVYGYLGEPVHFAVAVVFCATLLALQARSARRGALVVALVGTGVVIEEALKAAIDPGFPSGHVTAWGTFLGMVAVCLGVRRSLAAKAALALLVASGVLAIVVLALYSAAHSVTDVVGGVVLSAALVSLGAALLRVPVRRASGRRAPARRAPARRAPAHRAPVRRAPVPAYAANMAAAMSAHTKPLRTEDILFSRGY